MYYVIVNPEAGRGKGGKLWIKTAKFFYKLGITYEAYLTNQQMDARGYSAALTEGKRDPRTIVVIGGDGTINEVLDGLDMHCPVTLCLIPAGSCNNLAKSLRISTKPEVCLRHLIRYTIQGAFPAVGRRAIRPNSQIVDYGVISYGSQNEHRRFLSCAGIGLDAAICQQITENAEKKGIFPNPMRNSMLAAQWKGISGTSPVGGYLLLDGKERVDFRNINMISAHIMPFDMGMRVAKDANPVDGQLTLKVIHEGSQLGMVPVMMNAMAGRKKLSRSMRTYTCKEVMIHLEDTRQVHVDGESCEVQKDILIRCIPGKLRMIL